MAGNHRSIEINYLSVYERMKSRNARNKIKCQMLLSLIESLVVCTEDWVVFVKENVWFIQIKFDRMDD